MPALILFLLQMDFKKQFHKCITSEIDLHVNTVISSLRERKSACGIAQSFGGKAQKDSSDQKIIMLDLQCEKSQSGDSWCYTKHTCRVTKHLSHRLKLKVYFFVLLQVALLYKYMIIGHLIRVKTVYM